VESSSVTLDSAWERRFRASQRRRAIWERIVAHLGGSCCICGYNTCIEALECHHVDPQEKEFTIADCLTSFERVLPELAKCELVCSNHHKEIHAGLHPGHIVMEDEDRSYDLGELEFKD